MALIVNPGMELTRSIPNVDILYNLILPFPPGLKCIKNDEHYTDKLLLK